MDLSTTYLGLSLAHPFMPGASPLVDDLDTVRRLEDAGASAIVMRSIFEEATDSVRRSRVPSGSRSPPWPRSTTEIAVIARSMSLASSPLSASRSASIVGGSDTSIDDSIRSSLVPPRMA